MSSRVNGVNAENLQDPSIKNPGYANAWAPLVYAGVGDSQQKLKIHVGYENLRHSINKSSAVSQKPLKRNAQFL